MAKEIKKKEKKVKPVVKVTPVVVEEVERIKPRAIYRG